MEEVTIKDIAKICGVGVSTVSRAINNHPDINIETKQMIMEVIKEYGYVPNNSARNLKRTDAKCIAVLVKGMSNPFFSSMVKIIEAETKKKKYTLVIHHVDFEEDEVDVALELVKEKRLKGIIFLGGFFYQREEKLSMLKVPMVMSTVGNPLNKEKQGLYSIVSSDDVKESAKVVNYLIQNGHSKIAMIAASKEDESIGKLRLIGYKKALEENNIPYREEMVRFMKPELEQYSIENGYEVTKELLESNEDFSALYVISDMMAVGAMRAIYEAGKNVPKDYSVVGYDGIEYGKYVVPSLTTLEQPIEEMAKETIALLFDVISGKKKHQKKVFQANLVIRESTRPL